MANIVDLHSLGDQKLEELLENAREEMFNLRFQGASARLKDVSRPKKVRREIAQIELVLHQRQLAVAAAAAQPEVAAALADKEWQAEARFSYEDNAWLVKFTADDRPLAQATVDLNQRKPRGRKERAQGKSREVVTGFEVS
jgi:large subunit ribosomal protein L29